MVKRKAIISVIFCISLFYIFANKSYALAAEDEERICKGVFIDNIEISGMTKAEAEATMKNFLYDLQSKKIAIIADQPVYKTLSEIGYTYEPNNYIDQAFGLVTSGNLIKKYKDYKDIEHGGKVYPLTFTFDEDRVHEIVKLEVRSHELQPVNATYSRNNGEFVYTEHRVGSRVDVDKTVDAIIEKLKNWDRKDIFIEAAMMEVMPEYQVEDLKKSNKLLGEFTTEFKDSTEDRAINVANGAKLINNTVLYPGQEFDSLAHLEPFNTYNGYAVGGAYRYGEIVESIGGGACQVTSTLYNAVLYSELEIVERSAHSMTVSYMELSTDAAVSEGGKNFRFKNNTDSPILIEGYTKDRTITFKIWGNETRDTEKRKIKFESVTLETYEPSSKDKIEQDPTKPKTYQKVTQKARKGYKAELYKVVYEDGKEVEKIKINTSKYAAEPRHVRVGTMQ